MPAATNTSPTVSRMRLSMRVTSDALAPATTKLRSVPGMYAAPDSIGERCVTPWK
jgi:hypothetical protein